MPKCQSCGKRWTWGESVKRSFQLGGGMLCPYCRNKQYYSARMRKRSNITLFIIPLILVGNLFFGPSIITVIILLSIIPVYTLLFPFFMELSNEEEPLF